MQGIPRSALILGLLGLLPFVWGAGTVLSPSLAALAANWLGPMFMGLEVLQAYGVVILSFMSGVLWGFATKTTGRAAMAGYSLSVLPALWAFFGGNGAPHHAAINLFVGFVALLMLDYRFARQGLAPVWWMPLRLMLTGAVLACLAVGVIWG